MLVVLSFSVFRKPVSFSPVWCAINFRLSALTDPARKISDTHQRSRLPERSDPPALPATVLRRQPDLFVNRSFNAPISSQ